MGRLPSYRDFTPLLGTMRLPAIPYSPSFELSRQKNPSPPTASDAQRRRDQVKVPGGWLCLALTKMFARPEYVPLWNSEFNVWRSGFAGFLSPRKKIWYCGSDPCPICEENQDAGAIDVEDDFPSGDDAEIAHPGCLCHTESVDTHSAIRRFAWGCGYRAALTRIRFLAAA